MANKIKVKLILELRDAHMSQNSIAATRNMSKSSVSEVCKIADDKQIHYADVKELSDDEVYQMFFPDKYTDLSRLYEPPAYDKVHSELKKVGVTLKLLWKEYKAECQAKGCILVGYSKYCEDYGKYVEQQALTNHLIHKPGIRCEVDWSGPTMKYVDADTGEIVTVYLFVATLPYSQYSYVEPCLDMNQKDMQEAGLDMVFVQDNQSCSVKGVLRGLHFQKEFPQGKLVRVVKGTVFDVAEFCYKCTDFYHPGDEADWLGMIRRSGFIGPRLWVCIMAVLPLRGILWRMELH